MTEREKMLRGMLYDPAHDTALQAEMAACKALCRQFNQLAYQTTDIEAAQAPAAPPAGRCRRRAADRAALLVRLRRQYHRGAEFLHEPRRRHSGRRRRDLWGQRVHRAPVRLSHLRPPLGGGGAEPGAGVRPPHPGGQRRLDRCRRPGDARRHHRRRVRHRRRQRGDAGYSRRRAGGWCPPAARSAPSRKRTGCFPDLSRDSAGCPGFFLPRVGKLAGMCYHRGAAGKFFSAAMQ